MLGRVMRDVQRKMPQPAASLQSMLGIAGRIFSQQRHDSSKLYSVHAPEVECIAKGKVHKKYEFGCKVAVASTTTDNWIVGIQAVHGNPYDGETLKPALAQVERLTGIPPAQVLVDQGFRGHQHHPEGVNVLIVGRRKLTEALKKLFHRRSAIEPVIGHTKHDHRLLRNHLLGKTGDKINALLAACGFNLAKLLRFFIYAEPVWRCA
jgi:IS5 family transposase